MKVWYTRAFDVPDDELAASVPLPETIGSIYTLRYYCRRSYEETKNLEVHAYADAEHGDKALELMQRACTTAYAQARVRRAVPHTILTNARRTSALNAWLDEAGALDGPARR